MTAVTWWEWLIVLGLWAWAMADIHLLRKEVDGGLRRIDQRRVEAVRALEVDLADLKRKLRLT